MKKYDYIIIGGGSGGIASANRAGKYGAKVLLIEENKIGGTCVNVGCVPKKVMWQASDIYTSLSRDAKSYGISTVKSALDFKKLVANREEYINTLHGAYYRGLDSNQVEVISGYAHFTDEHTVEVDGVKYSAPHILIATGGHSSQLEIPGGQYAIDSDGFFALDKLPHHLLVLGAGYIAAELSGVVHGLGTKVSWAYRKERPLRQFDEMLADNLVDIYQEEGMSVYRNSVPSSIEKVATGYQVNFENDKQITADLVLFAGGRKPNVTGFGLENTSV